MARPSRFLSAAKWLRFSLICVIITGLGCALLNAQALAKSGSWPRWLGGEPDGRVAAWCACDQAKGHLDQVIADYDQAIKRDSKRAIAYDSRGLAFSGKGDFDKPLAAFAKGALPSAFDEKKLPRPIKPAGPQLNFLILALAVPWLGVPVFAWLAFLALIAGLMVLDLTVFHRRPHVIGFAESLTMALFYVGIGLAFGAALWLLYYVYPFPDSIDPAIKAAATDSARAWAALNLYYTGYVVEKTLSIDNIFLISLVFAYFKVPRGSQHRVLFWGILGAIALRGVLIGAGAALISRFGWILYVFAVFLIFTGAKMLFPRHGEPDIGGNVALRFLRKHLPMVGEFRGEAFIVRAPDPRTGKSTLLATPLFAALVTIEFVDVVFAVDSVPAIFAITPEPFIVYTSNIFAILGLRTLYFTLAAMVHRFTYLKYTLALVLMFIGAKVFFADFLPGGKLAAGISLAITISLLLGGVLYSMWKTRSAAAKAANG